jgi:hypothetical protein
MCTNAQLPRFAEVSRAADLLRRLVDLATASQMLVAPLMFEDAGMRVCGLATGIESSGTFDGADQFASAVW